VDLKAVILSQSFPAWDEVRETSAEFANFILLMQCIFLQLIHQPINALNKIQFITSIKLLHAKFQAFPPRSRYEMRSSGYYAAFSGNSLSTVVGFLTLEDGTDRLSRNVGKELRTRCVIAQTSAVLKY